VICSYSDKIPYHEMVLHLPLMAELTALTRHPTAPTTTTSPTDHSTTPTSIPTSADGVLMEQLRAVPPGLIAHKQALLRKYAPLLAYPYPRLVTPSAKRAKHGDGGSAAGVTAAAAARGANAVTMAISRLAADVAAV
jgi:hypothetical protein